MKNIDADIGKRLREIRNIFNEGSKLSAEQFAYLLDETGDRIRNYELGRANIPIRLLYSLFVRGINPTYIVTGNGSRFAENEEGRRFKQILNDKKTINSQKNNINKSIMLKAVAGKLKK